MSLCDLARLAMPKPTHLALEKYLADVAILEELTETVLSRTGAKWSLLSALKVAKLQVMAGNLLGLQLIRR